MSRIKIPDEDRNGLRHQLDGVSGRSREKTALHRKRVDALSSGFPHSIKYVEEGGGDSSDCMVYTLQIPLHLVNIAATFQGILDEFIVVALPKLLEQLPDSEVSEGEVILYFKDGKTKHVGRTMGHRIISKWGKNPVYEHDIFEVPASYGDEYELFRQPSVRYITNKFIEFVRRHCRYIDIRETFEESVVECGYDP